MKKIFAGSPRTFSSPLWLGVLKGREGGCSRRKVLSLLKPFSKNSFWLATFVIYYRNLQIHPFFTLSLGLLSSPNLSFSDICKVRNFLLSLSMKCWNSVWNAKSEHSSSIGRRSENIAVASTEDKTKSRVKLRKLSKLMAFRGPHPQVFFESHPKTGWKPLWYFMDTSNIWFLISGFTLWTHFVRSRSNIYTKKDDN